jgi:hypothetical protein
MLRLIILSLLSIPLLLTAQCLEGDCENGYGKMDMGWCTYEGTFKDGLPDGAGTVDYGDYKYEGEVTEGLENGVGRHIYPDGRVEEVEYAMGKEVEPQYIKTPKSEWKSYEAYEDPYCVSGDCKNGYGTYHFPTGNKYTGPFKDWQPHGQGEWEFANGDRYVGGVENGKKEGSGTYYFADGWKFSGTYSNDEEYTGTYTSPDGRTVDQRNGSVIIPEPKVTYTYSQAPAEKPCLMCNGSGTMTIPGRSRYVQGTPSYITYRDGYGNTRQEYAGGAPVYTVRDPDKVVTCNICGG